jgi:transposase-like protein
MNSSGSVSVRGRLSREEGKRLVREFEQSGLTRTAFCRTRGIGPKTLDYHRRKHTNQVQPELGQLLPVQLVGPLPVRSSHLRVELANGRRIAVEDGFDAVLLKRLIVALEG